MFLFCSNVIIGILLDFKFFMLNYFVTIHIFLTPNFVIINQFIRLQNPHHHHLLSLLPSFVLLFLLCLIGYTYFQIIYFYYLLIYYFPIFGYLIIHLIHIFIFRLIFQAEFPINFYLLYIQVIKIHPLHLNIHFKV